VSRLFSPLERDTRCFLDLAFSDSSDGTLDRWREPSRVGFRPWLVHHPSAHLMPTTAIWLPALRLDLLLRKIVGKAHDDAILHQARDKAAANVNGREAEHLSEANAPVFLGELGEKGLQV
jgi:hypothetical protein